MASATARWFDAGKGYGRIVFDRSGEGVLVHLDADGGARGPEATNVTPTST